MVTSDNQQRDIITQFAPSYISPYLHVYLQTGFCLHAPRQLGYKENVYIQNRFAASFISQRIMNSSEEL